MIQAPTLERRAVTVQGIVQGVGFRPFIYAVARRHGLTGLVRNDSTGVYIEVEGPPVMLDRFLSDIREQAPPLALVEDIAWQRLAMRGDREFTIVLSRQSAEIHALVSPDVATCADCLRELLDPADRRYHYPFINCTNCGPRFTITRAVPYDRAMTTMAPFTMCVACQSEYDDPADRRFHAQPNACPACGPRVCLLDRYGHDLGIPTHQVIARAAQLLRDHAVLAIKGIGGYHLACNPFDRQAVSALRSRKARQDKPFALMACTIEQVGGLCVVTPDEESLLNVPARPIVLLERRHDDGIVAEVAPRQSTLGVMLAYTPLHHLLLREAGIPLVMTSGNRSDEPIAYRDDEALAQLAHIADYFLVHDRTIHMRCDDSVMRAAGAETYPIRRSRGYAPTPLAVVEPFDRHILACGGAWKNTFCLARDRHAFLSQHIGDLENYETYRSFQEGVTHYSRLFDVRPALVAYDLHPEYLSTKYARELEDGGLPAIGVQHHHAHIASCLADNQRPTSERVIGVALDGTGYGTDGAIWGGEFLQGSVQAGFARRAHLAYMPLPGGEAAIKQPWRLAITQLIEICGVEQTANLPLALTRRAGERDIRRLEALIRNHINTPQTSSAGRLFDAVAALLDLPGTERATYEGQAAVELELVAERATAGTAPRAYPFTSRLEGDCWILETREIVAAVVEDMLAGRLVSEIAAAFHHTIAALVVSGCARIRESGEIGVVALSGGVFQNMLLLRLVTAALTDRGFIVYRHHRVPANDGGLALGQAVLADCVLR
jgi:hydrogenase maturation protein HypF